MPFNQPAGRDKVPFDLALDAYIEISEQRVANVRIGLSDIAGTIVLGPDCH